MRKVDVLVIGSGIAGLSYALKVAMRNPDKKILVAAKAGELETNTRYAQGGIAAVIDLGKDSYQKHINDTMEAGAWLSDRQVVEMVVKEAPERIADLVAWGVEFDRTGTGGFHLGKEGGHSENRVLHCQDMTGASIEQALCNQLSLLPNIEVLTHHFAIDLIKEESYKEGVTCHGALLLDMASQKTIRVLARVTMLATGGAGQVFEDTTNPVIATGDGIAMASRAGATIEHMEFVQFHPTALYNPGEKPSFLVSEAVRGFGGILRNKEGAAFADVCDPRGSLAPRDVVARAIDAELKRTGAPCVYLDVSHLDIEAFKAHFPTIYNKCINLGIDPATEGIPVVPASHYFCGGIKTDDFAKTSIHNLYACGECASTGLHGANRLASNSLLEALVFAHRASEDTCMRLDYVPLSDPQLVWFAKPDLYPKNTFQLAQLRKEVQTLMSSYASIVRNRRQLRELSSRLLEIKDEVEMMVSLSPVSVQLYELNNLLTVARLVSEAAIRRFEPIGLHYLIPDGEFRQRMSSTGALGQSQN
jgi:L-aspartate oxidase